MATTQKLTEALASLRPGAEFLVRGDVIEWIDAVQTQPSEQEIASKVAELSGTTSAEATRVRTIRSDTGRVDLLARLKTATPAQIDTWVDNNVTTIVAARTLFKAIIKIIALDVRS